MGRDGRCTGMAGQRVTGFPTIHSYPAVERYGFKLIYVAANARMIMNPEDSTLYVQSFATGIAVLGAFDVQHASMMLGGDCRCRGYQS
jgi:hypothetical protein